MNHYKNISIHNLSDLIPNKFLELRIMYNYLQVKNNLYICLDLFKKQQIKGRGALRNEFNSLLLELLKKQGVNTKLFVGGCFVTFSRYQ